MKTPTINSRILKLEVLKGTATRASVNAVESRTTSLESDVATAQGDISTLQGNVTTLTQGIVDAVSTHNTAPDAHADLRTLVAGKQDSLTISPVGTALLDLATPSGQKIPRINADASVTLIDVPSNVEEVDADFVSISYNPSGASGGGSGVSSDLAVCAWAERVSASGGTLSSSSVTLAEALMTAIRAAGVLPKVQMLMPLLGADLAAALQPLVDRCGCSPMSVGFTDFDFAEGAGLQGAAGKVIHLRVPASALGVWGNGGVGYWELSMPMGVSSTPLMGYSYSPDARYGLFLRTSTPRQLFWWGAATPTEAGSTSVAATNGHYYGQRSSNTVRQLWADASLVGTSSTTADNTPDSDIVLMSLMGSVVSDTRVVDTYHLGRCGIAYFTDGTLTETEVSSLHTALAGWMSAAGRI